VDHSRYRARWKDEGGGRFSLSKEADEAMRAGEAAYARNDHDAALKAYARAAKIDPRIYEAPLFSGDVFLQQEEWQKAGEWYARAIQLDPDRETAYRYWGDALLRQSRLDEARDKYVEAVIVEPYTGYIWRNGLFRWADKKGVHLGHPKIEPQSSVSPLKDNHMTITIDPKSLEKNGDGTSAWMAYAITRAAWSVNDYERFKKAFPTEKEYRHSLKEEADALRQVVEIVKSQIKDGKIKQLDAALAELVKIHDEGLLEAYILFGRVGAINSIGTDYADYGHANRDKLRRYLREYVTSGKY
jgi:tetratricopeptide (TPR) repeat protein